MFSYFLIIIPILVGFTFIFKKLWGPTIWEFTDIISSFL